MTDEYLWVESNRLRAGIRIREYDDGIHRLEAVRRLLAHAEAPATRRGRWARWLLWRGAEQAGCEAL